MDDYLNHTFLPILGTETICYHPVVARAKVRQGPHRWHNVTNGIDAVVLSVDDWDGLLDRLNDAEQKILDRQAEVDRLERELHQAAE